MWYVLFPISLRAVNAVSKVTHYFQIKKIYLLSITWIICEIQFVGQILKSSPYWIPIVIWQNFYWSKWIRTIVCHLTEMKMSISSFTLVTVLPEQVLSKEFRYSPMWIYLQTKCQFFLLHVLRMHTFCIKFQGVLVAVSWILIIFPTASKLDFSNMFQIQGSR